MILFPFSDWPVQTELLETLYKDLSRGHVPHTMLFVGPIEQTRVVTEFLAKTLLCSGPSAPCGSCESCRQFASGNHPDYLVVDAQGNAAIKTGQVEQVQERLKLRAHFGGRLIYVLHRMDTATPVAANRLLKTLEEPSAQIIALLTATNAGRVLPTIRSRCFLYRLDADDSQLAGAAQENPELAEPSADAAAQTSQSEAIATVSERVIQWTQELLCQPEPPLLLADSFLKISSALELSEALDILSSWLRDVLHYRIGDYGQVRQMRQKAELEKQSASATPVQLGKMIELVLGAKSRLNAHVLPNLNMEQLCIRLREVK